MRSVALSFRDFFNAFTGKDFYTTFFNSLSLKDEGDVICYLSYLPTRHVLIARGGKGLASFENLGVALSHDQSFDLEKLRDPARFELLREFCESALGRTSYVGKPIEVHGEPVGVLLLASHRPLSSNDFSEDWKHALELFATHQVHLKRSEKLDHFCPDTDVLTVAGLYDQIEKEMARSRRTELPLSLIALRVDNYAVISQDMNGIQRKNWGHALARLLKKNSRLNDFVARLNEGYFVILLPHTKWEGAKIKAERFMSLISNSTLRVGGRDLAFTVSAVVNEYPRLSEDGEELLKKSVQVLDELRRSARFKLVEKRPRLDRDFEVES